MTTAIREHLPVEVPGYLVAVIASTRLHVTCVLVLVTERPVSQRMVIPPMSMATITNWSSPCEA
jgi:hypothetical protein